MIGLLRQSVFFARQARKGNISIRMVALVLLGMMTVALIYVASSNWLQDIGSNFVGGVEYPTP